MLFYVLYIWSVKSYIVIVMISFELLLVCVQKLGFCVFFRTLHSLEFQDWKNVSHECTGSFHQSASWSCRMPLLCWVLSLVRKIQRESELHTASNFYRTGMDWNGLDERWLVSGLHTVCIYRYARNVYNDIYIYNAYSYAYIYLHVHTMVEK